MQALATALAGVIVGILLRYVADWLTESRRVRKEFRDAALCVYDELRANVVKLEIALETAEDPELLELQTYQSHQMLLARHLPAEVRDAVRGAYVHGRVHRAFQVRNRQGQRVGSTPVVQEALDKARRARELLRSYIPEGTAEI
jgi:hypothetical protein